MEEIKLKRCPYCGGVAEVKQSNVFTSPGVCVRCTEQGCHVHTDTITYNCVYMRFDGRSEVYVTRDMAIRRVAEMWNRRV